MKSNLKIRAQGNSFNFIKKQYKYLVFWLAQKGEKYLFWVLLWCFWQAQKLLIKILVVGFANAL
jgi:hypothetical protein